MIDKCTLLKAAILNHPKAMTDLIHLTIEMDTLDGTDKLAAVCAYSMRWAPMVSDCYTWANVKDTEVLEAVLAIINETEE